MIMMVNVLPAGSNKEKRQSNVSCRCWSRQAVE
jgi:hypothetical protein